MSAGSDPMVLARCFARHKPPTGSLSGTDGKEGRKFGGVKIMIIYREKQT